MYESSISRAKSYALLQMENEVRKLDVEEGFASSVLHSCLFFPDGSCGDLRRTRVTSFFPAVTYTFLPA